MKAIAKMALVWAAQLVMATLWIAAHRLMDSFASLLSDSALMSFVFAVPVMVVGAIAYFLGLRLVVGAVYHLGNGKGPRAWLREIRRSLRRPAKAVT
jgi:hypothetical protein